MILCDKEGATKKHQPIQRFAFGQVDLGFMQISEIWWFLSKISVDRKMYVGRQQLILAYFGVVSTSFKHGTKVVFEHLATFNIEDGWLYQNVE